MTVVTLSLTLAAAGCSTAKSVNVPLAAPSPAISGSAQPTSPATVPQQGGIHTSQKPAPAAGSIGHFAASPSWVQEFNGSGGTPSIFKPETGNDDGWGDDQIQYYTASGNAFERAGYLNITARKVPSAERSQFGGFTYTSARLTTKGTFTPTYGRIVFENVSLPQGKVDGTWPALWLWPAGQKYSETAMPKQGFDGPVNGEIDVMEWVGIEPEEHNCSFHAYAHYHKVDERSGQVAVNPATNHTYWLEWTPTSLKSGMDDKVCRELHKQSSDTIADWPYDQPYFLILNLAMGGSWGGLYANQYGIGPDGVDPEFTTAELRIGAIKYYPYIAG